MQKIIMSIRNQRKRILKETITFIRNAFVFKFAASFVLPPAWNISDKDKMKFTACKYKKTNAV